MRSIWRRLAEQLRRVVEVAKEYLNHNPLGLLLGLILIAILIGISYLRYSVRNLGFDTILWQWLELLIIPVALALIVWYFERRNMTHEISVAQTRANQQALESCLEYVSEQVLALSSTVTPLHLQTAVIRARVLEVLSWLNDDQDRRDQLLRFLRDTELLMGSAEGRTPKIEPLFDDAEIANLNLSGAILSGATFVGCRFSNVNLEKADLSNTVFDRANMNGAVLRGANLANARLQNVHLSKADLSDANLTGAKLTGAIMPKARLVAVSTTVDLPETSPPECDLSEADLRGADLSVARLDNVNFRRALLKDTIITADTRLDNKWRLVHDLVNHESTNRELNGEDLSGANLSDVSMAGAQLVEVNLIDADLSRAQLQDSVLRQAKLQNALLAGTDLSRADLRGVDLRGVDLRAATLDYAKLAGTQVDNPPLLSKKWGLIWTILNPLSPSAADSVPALEAGNELEELLTTAAPPVINLYREDLGRADLRGAGLRGYDLTGASLSSSYLDGADLSDAILQDCDLANCSWKGAIVRPEQLQSAKNVAPEWLAAARSASETVTTSS